ncbi:MAG: MoxR family ATPase, partial [Clostridiales bacterium]|nr:MoxR family ATPase [Clostridiales bacterium]
FVVLATQNPVERESTFMLPAAQMDRFFVCLSMGYPTAEEEEQILVSLGDGTPYDEVKAVVGPDVIRQIRREASKVQVSEHCLHYMVELVQKTRSSEWLKQGGSPRASRSLYQGSKSWAAMQGRDYVIPEDIRTIWE